MKQYLFALFLFSITVFAQKQSNSMPNIIFIYADDMGIGDVSHNKGKAPTPYIDKMASEGMRFTDAHTSSSVCTPSRYSLLTGRYNWRTRLSEHVFSTPDEKPLIKKDEKTIANLLKQVGYNTACIGKWHLGIDWETIPNYELKEGQKGSGWNIDYSKPAGTPTSNGFDYFFGITSSLDMPPYLYIKNKKATSIPTRTRPGRGRKGPIADGFAANHCLQDFAKESVGYINEQAKNDKPFFLYVPLTSPHTPIVPSAKWKGKSSIGAYGDFLMETDWVVGQVLNALDQNKLADNTLIFFSADNGCSKAAKIDNLNKMGHFPSGNLRGSKADIYEGGHRVPFVARWPKVIPANTTTSRLTCLTDVMATCAEITNTDLKTDESVDGISFLNTLKNPSKNKRTAIVHHSINGSFAIRQGDWKLALCPGSGGWSYPKPGQSPADAPKVQLFDLSKDIGEQNNLALQNPEKVNELKDLLLSYVAAGRSTAGSQQENDRKVSVYPNKTPIKKRKKRL